MAQADPCLVVDVTSLSCQESHLSYTSVPVNSPCDFLTYFLSLSNRDFLPGGRRDYTVQVQLR